MPSLVRTAGAGVLVATLVALSLPGQAGATSLPRADESDNGPAKLMMVLDSSGSMKEQAAGGETKIQAAKKALTQVIAKLPADQPVGLRVFGAKVFSSKDRGACTDSQIVAPIGTGNRAALQKAVGQYRPYGETPIGYALQQAGKDLGSSGKRHIVLVSDGVPTCKPDPCVVARQLSKNGIDLKIDVVGLDVNSQARSALECIAKAGHGVYYDVDNSKDFANSLITIATRAANPYAAIGQAVTGTDTATDAPKISNGDWLDETTARSTKYYAVERKEKGSTLHFSAAFQDPSSSVGVVSLETADGQQCGASGGVDVTGTNSLVSLAATAGPITSTGDVDKTKPCAKADTVVAKVEYRGTTDGIPVEMRVTEIPAVTNIEDLPKAVDNLAWVNPPSGSQTQISGGTSFSDATAVESGAFSGNIVRGETQTFHTKLDWGQQLTAAVSYAALEGPRADAITQGISKLSVQVFAPTRAPAAAAATDAPSGFNTVQAAMLRTGGAAGAVAGPVRFLNTGSTKDGIEGADTAGDYTIVVSMSKNEGKSIPIPYTLRVGVSGQQEGVPDFASEPVSPEKKSGKGAIAAPAAADDSGFPIGPVLGGLGVLALVAAGVIAFRARTTSG